MYWWGISEEDWFIDKLKKHYKEVCIEYLEADFYNDRN